MEIEIWMKRKGFTVVGIQRALEFANHGTVSNTLAGRKHNRKVLQYLLTKGCPARYLDLPEDMREAA
ncbi:hypothetical protein [Thiovibrio frasassiensis]|uniref:DNA-binding protein n=1 Tax=Thiovibrio frasassiensis TaxID=2984131 RepID=A0A9X4RL82_9BACT|nr:hypothetical protein [Thiovibrio frasassiensis]MDG4475404.1 hypothetical protein [Thiovibrio frasassiensis]